MLQPLSSRVPGTLLSSKHTRSQLLRRIHIELLSFAVWQQVDHLYLHFNSIGHSRMAKVVLPRHLQVSVKTHAEKVCSLYKRAFRNLWSIHDDKWEFRYHAVLLRARFDEHKNEKDLRKAKMLLEEGEKELYEDMHYQPLKFSYSPGGINYGRSVPCPDWVLDFWHPLEKAQYPEYFARREQRKQEYIERWEKKYGKPHESGH